MDLIPTLVSSIASSALVAGLLVWLFKSWISERLKNAIKAEYDQKLETHKAQLKAQADVEIERLRSQLSIAATEHQVRFSKLHDKQADVVVQIYTLLVEANTAATTFVSASQGTDEARQGQAHENAITSLMTFVDFLEQNRIFLPERVCTQIEELVNSMGDKITKVRTYMHYRSEDLPAAALEVKERASNDAWSYFQEKFPVARSALEHQLRIMLGSKESKNSKSDKA